MPPSRTAHLFLVVVVVLTGTSFVFAADCGPDAPKQPVWDISKLKEVPPAQWGAPDGLVQEVYYENEPSDGKPTRVFAYFAKPEGTGPFPAVVLVHGGGGKAFREWAELWANRGYAAIAPDLAGHGPDGARLSDGGPNQGNQDKFQDFDHDDYRKMWTYHAVAAVIRAHSLLASREDVDANRIAVTGISWGGYLTCIVAGLDDRLKAAVPVYGCGFLGNDKAWMSIFDAMSEEHRRRWLAYFDPSEYLPNVKCPIFFLNGTDDGAFPADIHRASYDLVPGGKTMHLEVHMRHSHVDGWAPMEIGLFIDSILKDAPALAVLGPIEVKDGDASAPCKPGPPVAETALYYSTEPEGFVPDPGGEKPYRAVDRKWQSVPATFDGATVRAELPKERPLVFFFSVKDDRGAVTTTQYAEAP